MLRTVFLAFALLVAATAAHAQSGCLDPSGQGTFAPFGGHPIAGTSGGCAPAAAVTVQPLRVVASGLRFNDTAVSGSSGKTEAVCRQAFWMGGDATEIRFAFNNWYYAATGATTNNATTAQVTKLAMETAGGTQTVPVTFSGARTLNLAIGDNRILSDPVYPSSFGLTKFAADTQFWVRDDELIPSTSGYLPTNVAQAQFTGNKCVVYAPANFIDQVDSTGALTTPTGAGSSVGFIGPVAVLGRYTSDASFRSVGMSGDSISLGVGDAAPLSPIGSGFVSRALSGNAVTGTSGVPTGVTAMMHMGRAGSGIQGHYANTQEMAYLGDFKTLVLENGTNSIGGGTTNSVLISSYLQPYVTAFRNAGGQKVIQLKITPKTTSTNGNFISMADQTPTANRGAGSGTATIDDWDSQIATQVTNGVIDLVVGAPSLLDATDPHYWLTNTFTAKISDSTGALAGTVLTVTSQPTGGIVVGQTLYTATSGFTSGTTVTAITSGNPATCSASTPCTFTVSASQSVASGAFSTYTYMTADGLHPQPVGHIAKGAALRTGILQFPYLLRRDVDPASNDNAPMFLRKAA